MAPGRRADILLSPELAYFTPSQMMGAGVIAARDGRLTDLWAKPRQLSPKHCQIVRTWKFRGMVEAP